MAALVEAVQAPQRDEPAVAREDEVVIADPEWWMQHPGELLDGLVMAEALREPPGLDLDALREQRANAPEWEPERDERDRGMER